MLSNSIIANQSHIGLLITDVGIKLVIPTKKASPVVVSVEATEQLFSHDEINAEVLVAILKTQVQKYKLDNSYVGVVFGEKYAFSREYQLPLIKLGEVEEALKWQIGTIFPVPPEDLYYDWKLKQQSSSGVEIVVVAVLRKFLDRLNETITASGLWPISFEPSASVLARALEKSELDQLILEVEKLGVSATLVRRGVSVLTSTGSFVGFSNGEEVMAEIHKTIEVLLVKAVKDGNKVDKIWMSGTGANESLGVILTTQLKVETKVLSKLGKMQDAEFVAPYIAARDLIKPPSSWETINLLPNDLITQYELKARISQAKDVMGWGGLMAGLVVVIAISFGVFITWQSQMDAKNIALAQSETNSGVNVPNLLNKSAKIVRVASLRKMPSKLLETIKSLETDKIKLKQVNYDVVKKNLVMVVVGVNRSSVMEIKGILENSGLVTSVNIPLSALTQNDISEIVVNMTVKD